MLSINKRLVLVLTVFALMISILTDCASAASKQDYKYINYSTQHYNVWYDQGEANGLSYAKGIEPYLGKAYNAALSVIGTDYRRPSQQGKLNIKFYDSDDGAYGYMSPSDSWRATTVFLNTNYLKDQHYGAWANTVAHETAHILFFNYTNAAKWNPSLWNHTTFLTEALSWYAADCVFGWADRRTSDTLSATYIRSQIKFYAGDLNRKISWAECGNIYNNPKSQSDLVFSVWNLRAIGSFLTDDSRTSGSSKLTTLLWYLKLNEANLSGFGRLSDERALSTFEEAFKTAYGKSANSSWQLGTPESLTNSRYLYEDYYKYIYK